MMRSVKVRPFILGGTFSSLVAILLVKAAGFVESAFVARIVGAYGFGLLTLVLSITNIMVALATLGIPSALTKFLAGEVSPSSQESHGTLQAAVRLSLVSTAVVCIAFVPVGYYLLLPYYLEPGLGGLLTVAFVFVGLTTPFILFANALQGLGKVTRLNILSIVAALTALPLAVLLATLFGEEGALVAFLVGSALPGILAMRSVYRAIRTLPRQEPVIRVGARTLLNYGMPVLLSGLLVLGALYVVNSWLAASVGFADLGDLAVANVLAAVIAFVPSAVGVPLAPLLSSLSISDPLRGRALVPKIMRITAFVSVPIVIFVIIFAREIIGLTYGPGFSRASPLLAILATSTLIASITGVVGSQIAGLGRMWLGLRLNLVWVGVLVSSAAVLIPRAGAIGASLGILISYAILGGALVYVGQRRLSLRFDGLVVPSVWSLGCVGLAFTADLFGGDARLEWGVAVLFVALATMYFLLQSDEKRLALDALALLGIQPRSP